MAGDVFIIHRVNPVLITYDLHRRGYYSLQIYHVRNMFVIIILNFVTIYEFEIVPKTMHLLNFHLGSRFL